MYVPPISNSLEGQTYPTIHRVLFYIRALKNMFRSPTSYAFDLDEYEIGDDDVESKTAAEMGGIAAALH